MEAPRRTRVVVTVILGLLSPISIPAAPGVDGEIRVAPKGGRAEAVSAWSVDSGGGESAGGDFSLLATIGQPEAGLISKCGTVFAGGLWTGAVDFQPVFCNGFESGDTGAWGSVVGGTEGDGK